MRKFDHRFVRATEVFGSHDISVREAQHSPRRYYAFCETCNRALSPTEPAKALTGSGADKIAQAHRDDTLLVAQGFTLPKPKKS